MMLQLLEAGAYLMSASYVHFDISINNVVINDRGQTALIDFGQSFRPTNNTRRRRITQKIYDPISMTEPPEITLSQAPDQKVDNVPYVIERKGTFASAEKLLGMKRVQQAENFVNSGPPVA
jgi:serine/threonine protein kinase